MGTLFTGKYVTLTEKKHNGRTGGLVEINNPDNPVNSVPLQALKEIDKALDVIAEENTRSFIVFYGAFAKIHAGADLNLFKGSIDPETVHGYLAAGADLDLKIKQFAPDIRTVSVIQGERYGGSVEWPLMAEFSVCTPEAAIRFSEINIGLIPGWNGILNVLLRSNWENALYLAATGDRIDADAMLKTGLVNTIGPQNSIFKMALDLATCSQPETGRSIESLRIREEIETIVAIRTDATRYRALIDEAAEKLKNHKLSTEKKDPLINQFVQGKLKELGRPIAPKAADSVFQLLDRHPEVNRKHFDGLEEMSRCELELCFELMNTQDRRVGVNSVLTSDPLEKIPVFVGK